MAEQSGIEWTDASWNPTTGCTKVSAGCANCYAERLSLRLQKSGSKKYRSGFKLVLHPEDLNLPLKWKKPKMVFVDSMSDLFHEDVPDDFILDVFDIIQKAKKHTFQILTKRPSRMKDFMTRYFPESFVIEYLQNVWLGTSIEDARVKERIKHLQATPAKVRFLSIEPLIARVGRLDLTGIHWVIVGGESGENARPCNVEWIREIKEQCLSAKVPFFFKQWGGKTSKSGGRLLDGKIWDQYPI